MSDHNSGECYVCADEKVPTGMLPIAGTGSVALCGPCQRMFRDGGRVSSGNGRPAAHGD